MKTKFSTVEKISTLVVLLAIIIAIPVIFKKDGKSPTIWEGPTIWESWNGKIMVVSCDPAPRPDSKLWSLVESWRPATREELESYSGMLPEGPAVLAGGSARVWFGSARNGHDYIGIDVRTGARVTKAYNDTARCRQLLVKKSDPIIGLLSEHEDQDIKLGIFPMPGRLPALKPMTLSRGTN